jgi:ABC-type iron transport system FetAB permease component
MKRPSATAKLTIRKPQQHTLSVRIPAIDSLRSLRIVWIPGLMAGMLLSGSPTHLCGHESIHCPCMIFAASGLTALVSTLLIRIQAFTAAEQLLLRPGTARVGAAIQAAQAHVPCRFAVMDRQ